MLQGISLAKKLDIPSLPFFLFLFLFLFRSLERFLFDFATGVSRADVAGNVLQACKVYIGLAGH
jgi:hypothetical protein